MDFEGLDGISPLVRLVKIQKAFLLSGEWNDYDNVFTYVEEGEADFILDGNRIHLRAGDAIIMHPLLTHIISITSQKPLVQYIFHFDLYFDKNRKRLVDVGMEYYDGNMDIADCEMYFARKLLISSLGPSEQFYLKNRFLAMHKEFMEKKSGYELILKAMATELLALCIRNSTKRQVEKEKPGKSWAAMEKAINYINAHYADEELDNLRISREAGLTPNYLTQLFREQIGIPIHKYLNHVRIEKAKKLMQRNEKNFTEVAYEVGFSGIHVFSKVFRKTVGMTPSEFMASSSTE